MRQHLEEGFSLGEASSSLILAGHEPGLADADCSRFPYIVLNERVTKEQAMNAGMRSVMVKKILEVWGQGSHLEDIVRGFEMCCCKPFPFPSHVGRKAHGFPTEELVERCKHLPDHEGGSERVTVHLFAPPETTDYWYAFACRVLGSGCFDLMHKYALTERKFLGPTTLTPELAFIMANLALADETKLVMDPYVGSGGALIGAAHHRAKLLGLEIDWRIIHGGLPYETFDQYGLPRPEFIRGDFSPEGRAFREDDVARCFFDAIIADPPYGIRAGARKTGLKDESRPPILPEHRASHVPQTRKYDGAEVIEDLLNAAAILLKPRGRLVYLHPLKTALWNEQRDAALPTHPNLKLLHTGSQAMRSGMTRILVTMEKNNVNCGGNESTKKQKNG